MPEAQSHKQCSKCKEIKPLQSFSPDKRRQSGLQSQCKECKNNWHRKYYRSPKFDHEAHRLNFQKYLSTAKAKRTRYRYHKQIPRLVKQARTALGHAVERGKIVKPNNCFLCGAQPKRIESHHHRGYEREYWLDVVWVCTRCHRKIEPRRSLHGEVLGQLSTPMTY